MENGIKQRLNEDVTAITNQIIRDLRQMVQKKDAALVDSEAFLADFNNSFNNQASR